MEKALSRLIFWVGVCAIACAFWILHTQFSWLMNVCTMERPPVYTLGVLFSHILPHFLSGIYEYGSGGKKSGRDVKFKLA